MSVSEIYKPPGDFVLPLYLDCNGSTPVEPFVLQRFTEYATSYLGNVSAHHAKEARKALNEAKEALVAEVDAEGIIFCSSATEANNMAIRGLLPFAESSNKKHIVLSGIEHSSVAETCEFLARQHGFELSLVAPEPGTGKIAVSAVLEKLRPTTLLVCCMQVNNETGVVQPVAELAEALASHEVYFHVDAAQGIAHITDELYPEASLRHPRIDMISISGHKSYGLCGIAALLLKRSAIQKQEASQKQKARSQSTNRWPPLHPIIHGGGQQGLSDGLKNLRSGSIPLALALSLRDAVVLEAAERRKRYTLNLVFREKFLQLLEPLKPQINGQGTLPHVANVSLPGIDAESALLNLRGLLSASKGAACTGLSSGNRVLSAMAFSLERQQNALRFSWCHRTPHFWESFAGCEWAEKVVFKLRRLQ